MNYFEDFLAKYNALTIEEKYKLGKIFHIKTGGTLSPHCSPKPVSIAIVGIQDDDGSIKLLGLKRGTPPFIDGIALPGGYNESLETGAAAAARELQEELGINLKPDNFEIFGNPLMSPDNNELCFYKYNHILPKSILASIKCSSEANGFELIDSKTPLCFPLHKNKVVDFFLAKTKDTNSAPTPWKSANPNHIKKIK
jgi:8-oxo-dGTP pyrophosphatase MutT (NUDIX family)